jgi:outer membrane protein assembly factor BamD (BamD/ComL family)
LKRELKRQMKQDELQSGLELTWTWLNAHQKEIRTGAIVAAVAIVILGGLRLWMSERAQTAREDFRRADEIFHAPLRSELPPDGQAAGPVFDTEAERYEKAMAAFDGFERRFPRHELAVRAKYYAGLSRMHLGKTEEAAKLLSEVAARRDLGTIEPSLALLALGSLYASEESWDEAVDAYQRLLEGETSVPRAQVLMSLGACLESANRLQEARSSYERVIREFPASVFAPEARSRAEFLGLPG